MQDGAGSQWTSLGQAPALQMAWRRLPAFRSDMERRSAVVSLIVALPVRRANESELPLLAAEFRHVNRILGCDGCNHSKCTVHSQTKN